MDSTDRPRFLPRQLIEIRGYEGKPRADLGEVYKAHWSYERNDWCIAVRLFVGEGQKVQFRNFYQGKLVAE